VKLKLFALNSSGDFGRAVADHLGVPLNHLEEEYFEDRECYAAPRPGIKENVRGCDVFVISSMYSDEQETINDKILKVLILCGALHDASAARITVVSPYWPYARQDRKTSSRAPITTKYLARVFQSVWVDRILSIDVHSPTAVQNAFHVPIDLLEANHLFAEALSRTIHQPGIDPRALCVMSPDSSGLNRARKFRKVLGQLLGMEISMACVDKVHEGKSITGHGVMGDVAGKHVVIYDDMISGGSTVLEATQSCFPRDPAGAPQKDRWAKSVFAAVAAHGLFVGESNTKLADPRIERVLVTDSIRPFRVKSNELKSKLQIISTTKLFAEAIRRIHDNESISDLLAHGNS
jgi:ribose-phosphate pyrophosphokinase